MTMHPHLAILRNTLSRSEAPTPGFPPNLQFIDFGCGSGQSIEFASSLVGANGIGIDPSDDAVKTCHAKGLPAERGNLLDFDRRNAAYATLAVDVIPELQNRADFEQALTNMIRAARNFALVQHAYFDADSDLALRGFHIAANFGRKIRFKPTAADYIAFAKRNGGALNLSGIGIFGSGSAKVGAMTLNDQEMDAMDGEDGPAVFRSLRVIFGRKDVSRFRRALEMAGSRNALFVWERS